MTNWPKKALNVIKQKINPIYPLMLSDKELTVIFQEQQVCPDCGVWDFREGPSGGMSINIYCANCGSWFNESGPFGLDRIFKSGNLDWRKYNINYGDNYYPYTWDILKTWHPVMFESDTEIKRKAIFDAVDECNGGGTIDQWAVKDYTLYFKEEVDAVAIKLGWS